MRKGVFAILAAGVLALGSMFASSPAKAGDFRKIEFVHKGHLSEFFTTERKVKKVKELIEIFKSMLKVNGDEYLSGQKEIPFSWLEGKIRRGLASYDELKKYKVIDNSELDLIMVEFEHFDFTPLRDPEVSYKEKELLWNQFIMYLLKVNKMLEKIEGTTLSRLVSYDETDINFHSELTRSSMRFQLLKTKLGNKGRGRIVLHSNLKQDNSHDEMKQLLEDLKSLKARVVEWDSSHGLVNRVDALIREVQGVLRIASR
jgi:hypothetical protein